MDTQTIIIIVVVLGVLLGVSQVLARGDKGRNLAKAAEEGNSPFPVSEDFTTTKDTFTHCPESIVQLAENLNTNEIVLRIIEGYDGMSPSIFVLTSQRVLRLVEKIGSLSSYHSKVEAILLSNVSNVFIEKKIFASIKIDAQHQESMRLSKFFDEDRAKEFVSRLRELLQEGATQPENSKAQLRVGRGDADLGFMNIEKVKLLLQSGNLSEADFYFDEQVSDWIELRFCEALQPPNAT